MALSKNMVYTLLHPPVPSLGVWHYYRDGRTLRALQSRGLIKSLSRQPRLSTWRYRYTKLGNAVTRQLNFLEPWILQEVVR